MGRSLRRNLEITAHCHQSPHDATYALDLDATRIRTPVRAVAWKIGPEAWPVLHRLSLVALILGMTACVQPDPNRQSGVARNDIDALDSLWPNRADIDPEFVRAAEVFSASGLAIWDGSRTVRGLWVAHPKADRTRKVRITNTRTGDEIDGILYRADRKRSDGVVTLSSDAAEAMNLKPGAPSQISIVGLRPKGQTSKRQRRTVETRAETELVSHISRLKDTNLVQVAAAAMRGMGYATIFEEPLLPGLLSGIRAFPRPDQGYAVPTIRVAVRPSSAEPMGVAEVRMLQDKLTGSGDLGAIISVSGFEPDIAAGLTSSGAHIELVDLDGLSKIWTTYYEQLSDPDRALLPLQPVYFLATQ